MDNEKKEQSEQGSVSVEQQQQVMQLIRNPNISRHYANGFISVSGEHDMAIIPLVNGVPMFILNLSFSTAKELALTLTEAVTSIEARIGEIKSLPANQGKQQQS